MPLGARLELGRVERALAREACGVEDGREMARPFAGGLLIFWQVENGFKKLPELPIGRGDQLRERHGLVEVLAQLGVEARAARELDVGAAEERRADEAAR